MRAAEQMSRACALTSNLPEMQVSVGLSAPKALDTQNRKQPTVREEQMMSDLPLVDPHRVRLK